MTPQAAQRGALCAAMRAFDADMHLPPATARSGAADGMPQIAKPR